VGAEPGRVRAGRATADAIGVERVAGRVEPLDAVRLAGPLRVQERLDPRHPLALAGLHLRRRPVDRVDLGPGADAGEEVVGRPPVGLEEPVPLDVVEHLPIPRAAAVGLRRPVEVRAAVVTEHAPLSGARTAAVRALGDLIVDYRRAPGLGAKAVG
jgi:hypothetical protein